MITESRNEIEVGDNNSSIDSFIHELTAKGITL